MKPSNHSLKSRLWLISLLILGLAGCLGRETDAPPSVHFVTAAPTSLTGDETPGIITVITSPATLLTATPTLIAASATPTATATPTCVPTAEFVQDVTLPDGSQVTPGSNLGKIWRVRNSGSCTWGPGYTIDYAGGERFASSNSTPLPAAQPGQTVDVGLSLLAPFSPGDYSGTWRLYDPNRTAFGIALTVKVRVTGLATAIPDCPTDLAAWPQPIADRLNRFNGDLDQLRFWLEDCGGSNGPLGGVFPQAIQTANPTDVVVIVQKGIAGTTAAEGSLLIYHLRGGSYNLAFQASADGRIDLQRVEDINLDGRPEVIWTAMVCGAHTCTGRLAVERWSGTQYEAWIVSMPEIASPSYEFRDTTPTGSGQEILIRSQGIASVGAGPQRPWTETYISPGGSPYQLAERVYGSSPCLYHQILDANTRFAATNRDYTAIIDAYLRALNDTSLQACWTLTDEVNVLRDFARFRLVLANAAIGDQTQAQLYRNTIAYPPLRGAADTFLTSFAVGNLAQACGDTTNYALANPTSWNFLADWGYANPTFRAEDLCPGFGSTNPAPAVSIRVSDTTVNVGDYFQVNGEVVGVGLPQYSLNIDGEPIVTVTYQNQTTHSASHPLFELTSFQADGQTVEFSLRARQAGTSQLDLTASGEVWNPAAGAYSWGSGSSEAVTVTISAGP